MHPRLIAQRRGELRSAVAPDDVKLPHTDGPVAIELAMEHRAPRDLDQALGAIIGVRTKPLPHASGDQDCFHVDLPGATMAHNEPKRNLGPSKTRFARLFRNSELLIVRLILLVGRFNRLMNRLNRLMRRFNRLMNRLNRLMNRSSRLMNRLNRLMNRSSRLMNRLDRLMNRLNRLMNRLNRLMNRFIRLISRFLRAPSRFILLLVRCYLLTGRIGLQALAETKM